MVRPLLRFVSGWRRRGIRALHFSLGSPGASGVRFGVRTGPSSMRTFGGDIRILGLANLLQVISMSSARGFLSVSTNDVKKTIQFCAQGIRLVSGVRRAI